MGRTFTHDERSRGHAALSLAGMSAMQVARGVTLAMESGERFAQLTALQSIGNLEEQIAVLKALMSVAASEAEAA